MIKKICAMFLFLMLFSIAAFAAGNVRVQYVLPDQYEDNTAITPVDQARITVDVFYRILPTDSWINFGTSSPGASFIDTSIPINKGTAVTIAATATLDGMTSVYTPAINFTLPKVKTKAPTLLQIQLR